MRWLTNLINGLEAPWNVFSWIGVAIVAGALIFGSCKLIRFVFKQIGKKKKGVHLAFFENVAVSAVVIALVIVIISSFSGAGAVWQSLLGGTAIISAVLAFAAQDVIKDILAGLMVSLHRPFDIGDRIVLEDGTAGIVENITLRHVVIRTIHSFRAVIPNSKINSMRLSNYSYQRTDRAVELRFSVGYGSDMDKVKKTIFRAVEESHFSYPGCKDPQGNWCYAPVLFREFAESALIMSVAVYYKRGNPTELVVDDINTRVREALIAAGIEIPYNYVNVVAKNEK
ncbi:MAG: mechanosensitive ion channel [Clostridia bacterium]|nr:mechanosensitive ion channel [Clostridia bacterium]MBR7032993.1 mechanosensitive ion channel [Clostridia bacterium]